MLGLDNFECEGCGWKSIIRTRIDRHVKEFPNCLFTEQSYQYLEQRNRKED